MEIDFPDGGRSDRRLCNCGATIFGGTFCSTCYENQTLSERVRHSWRDWRQRRLWNRDEVGEQGLS